MTTACLSSVELIPMNENKMPIIDWNLLPTDSKQFTMHPMLSNVSTLIDSAEKSVRNTWPSLYGNDIYEEAYAKFMKTHFIHLNYDFNKPNNTLSNGIKYYTDYSVEYLDITKITKNIIK